MEFLIEDLTLGGLIGAPSDIWDLEATTSVLDEKLGAAKDVAEIRTLLVEVLKARMLSARSTIETCLKAAQPGGLMLGWPIRWSGKR